MEEIRVQVSWLKPTIYRLSILSSEISIFLTYSAILNSEITILALLIATNLLDLERKIN